MAKRVAIKSYDSALRVMTKIRIRIINNKTFNEKLSLLTNLLLNESDKLAGGLMAEK